MHNPNTANRVDPQLQSRPYIGGTEIESLKQLISYALT